jgi:hypothetical protein
MNKLLLLLLVSVFITPMVVWAETGEEKKEISSVEALSVVSPMISYQGVLKDSGGNPVSGVVSMTFRLYNAATGGTLLWSQTKSVSVSSGLFSTSLDNLNAAYFDQALWLEIVVGGETLSPRQQLLGTAYAFSLVPGAKVSGSLSTPLLTVNNSYYSGIEGKSYYGEGVRGISTSGYGVYGDGYFGVYGNGSYGVYGSGRYYGVYGYSSNYPGVYGYSYYDPGGYFYSNGDAAVRAYSYGTSSGDDGVYAYSSRGRGVYAYSPYNTGVYGESYNKTGVYGYSPYNTGVYGSSYNYPGVYGYSSNGAGGVFSSYGDEGVQAYSYSPYSYDDGVEAYSREGSGVYGGSYNNTGGYFYSSNNIGVRGTGGSGSGDYGGYFTSNGYRGLYASGASGWYAAYFNGDIYVNGNIYKSGSVSFVQDHPTDKTKEIVYVSLEGGENGVYTRGSAQLKDGIATVKLAEDFSLVASSEGLTAQVTPTSDCNGLYVVSKSPTEIVIKELKGGTSNAAFDYLVNGLRKGYENYQAIQDKDTGRSDPGLAPEHVEVVSEPKPGPIEPKEPPAEPKEPIEPKEPVLPEGE